MYLESRSHPRLIPNTGMSVRISKGRHHISSNWGQQTPKVLVKDVFGYCGQLLLRKTENTGILFWCGFFFTPNRPVYVSRAWDSEHGSVAVKFVRASAIEKEARVLKALANVDVHGIICAHGLCYMNPFYGISMELHRTNIAWLI